MREKRLVRFLEATFTPQELRRFLRYGPDGTAVLESIPQGGLSGIAFCSDVVEQLSRRGMVDEEFFDRLIVVRPAREPEIRTLRAEWEVPARDWISTGSGASAVSAAGSLASDSTLAAAAAVVAGGAVVSTILGGLVGGLAGVGAAAGLNAARLSLGSSKPGPAAAKVFISYSRRDRGAAEELSTHLAVLVRKRRIWLFDEMRIQAGVEWQPEVDLALSSADVVILLVSPDYLATEWTWGREMVRALERAEKGECAVIPVVVRPCDWADAPFRHLRVLPSRSRSIRDAADSDAAWVEVTRAVEAATTPRKEHA